VADLEGRVPAQHEVELLVAAVALFAVLVDDPVAGVAGRPGVDPEGLDAHVVADRPPRAAPVSHLLDLVELRDLVAAHRTSFRSSSLAACSAALGSSSIARARCTRASSRRPARASRQARW